ncbi:MAG: tubulin-like doman-containing protein, partial [Pirellulaceae bacterium]|nr:tubulin-like doman-containing protein [Pirellulaceae bacterium]
IRLLCLDADRRTLYESTMGDEYTSLQNYETMDIPLRSSDEYRKDANLDLSWIGRRWLYNIPKNQLTGSLRPLGRLAFNFHHERIYRKISDELAKAALPENLAVTAETTQLLPSDLPPQVIFVGSVAGGLGSGMFLDLAFTTRVCMTEQGFSSDHLFGLFAHSTSRYVGDHRLSIANSVSFLNELYHFNLNGYPGNAPCDIPAFDDETPVFDGTYLVHLGDDISSEEFERGVDGMAEYLYQGTATRCRAFFDVCRNTEEFEAGMLKTMGISSICQGLDDLSEQSSERMVDELLTLWLEEDSFASRSSAAETMANSIIEASVLSLEPLERAIIGFAQECLGDQPENLLLQKVISGLQERPAGQFSQLAYTNKILDESVGEPAPDRKSENPDDHSLNPNLCQFLEPKIPELARQTRLEITEVVMQLIDHPDFRISGARSVLRSLLNRLEKIEVDLEYQREKHWLDYEGAEQRLTDMLNEKDCPLLPEEATVSSVTEMVTDRMRHVIEAYKRKLVRLVRYELQNGLDRVDEYRTSIDMLWSRSKNSTTTKDRPVTATAEPSSLYQLLQSHATDRALARVEELATQLENKILQPRGGLRAIVDEGGNRMRMLPKRVKHEAQMMISTDLRNLRLDSLIIDSGLPPQVLAASIQELVSPAKPLLYNCGGTARLLIAVPSGAPIATLTSYIEENMSFSATVIPSTCGDFSICVEMDRMPSENVAMSLLNLQPDCAELVERLHCRTDVEWSNLTTVN